MLAVQKFEYFWEFRAFNVFSDSAALITML